MVKSSAASWAVIPGVAAGLLVALDGGGLVAVSPPEKSGE
jgi:hypothetical protein